MSTIPYQETYNSLVEALTSAGNATSAQFQALSGQFTAAQFAQMAEQSQQFSAVRNLDESIRFFQITNPDCEFALAPSSTGTGLINSNNIPPTNSAKNTFTSTLASNSVLNIADTVLALGEVRKPAQTGTQQALAFASRTCLPVQIASVATMLGKQIDSSIYKLANAIGLNPPASLDPQTWNGLVSNDNVFGQVFNWLLNINPDTGELSTYTDIDSLAYSALWLKEQGFFDVAGDASATIDPSIYNPSPVAFTPLTPLSVSNITDVRYAANTGNYNYSYTANGNIDYSLGFVVEPNARFCFVSKESFTVTLNYHAKTPPYSIVYSTTYQPTAITTTVNNTPCYVYLSGYRNSVKYDDTDFNNLPAMNVVAMANLNDGVICTQIATIIYDGIVTEPVTIPGVEPNGGDLPDTSSWVDVPATRNSIVNQYPDIMSNPIVVDTVQPDGSTKQYTYVPVPLPADIDQLGNPDTQNVPATQQSVNPETATNPQLQMIIQLLTQLAPLLAPVPQPEPDPGQHPEDVKPPVDGTNETNPDYPGSNDIGIGIAPLPIVPTGTASALWTVYNPSQSELNAFGGWLWSPAFIDNILKLFANPMDAIIGVHKIFAPVPSGSSKHIKCGFLDSGVSASTVNTQYIDVDCGSVNLFEYFGNVFDYDPHTKVSIYLPFIGVVPLKTAEVMRSTINVVYGVDLYTGSCLAKIHITRDAGAGGILYSYGGSCACYYPLSSGSYSGIISGVLSAAVGITGTALSGSPIPAVRGIAHGIARASLDVQHTGGFTGPSGVMGPKIPYIIIVRPQSKMAFDYESYDGVPSNTTTTLGNCHGYTKCKEVHLKVYGAYKEESDEIVRLLKEGVLFPE